jgi:epoxyqueuosine reductase
MEGSPIRRIGYERWLRNLAVGLGNTASEFKGRADIVNALQARLDDSSEMVREHITWALTQHLD